LSALSGWYSIDKVCMLKAPKRGKEPAKNMRSSG
jgi:hypothetical protein